MGDVVMSSNRRSWPQVLTCGLALSAVLSGCAARGGAATETTAADGSGTASASVAAVASPAAAPAEAPVMVTGLTLRESAPGMRLDLKANGPVVWTQYRDAEGRLVLELPNAVTAPDVAGLASDTGLVSAVRVEDVEGSGRPLVRLAIETRQEAEHQLVLEGNTLLVSLSPVGYAADGAVATAAAGDPVAGAEPEEQQAMSADPIEPLAPIVAPAGFSPGTADAPASGGGDAATATRLSGVELLRDAGNVTVAIRGDGTFAWKAFRLSGPERLVVDLEGVTNSSSGSAVVGDGILVERVRVAQFQSEPSAIARVVVDMAGPSEIRIVEGSSGLQLHLGDHALVAAADASPTPDQTVEASSPIEPTPESTVVAEVSPSSEPAVEVVTSSPQPAASTTVASVEPVAERPAVVLAPPAREVALFEALDVPQDDTPMPASSAGAPNYAALEVGELDTKYTGEPINFSLRDADIREVLRTFAKLSGLNVIVQPGVTGSVTVQFEQVPWDQALEQILKINNLWYELEGNIMRIAPRDTLNQEAAAEAERRKSIELSVPLRTIVKRVSYAEANTVASLLRSGGQGGLLSQRGSVTVDARTNTLIIKELPSFMDSVLAIIEEIDEPEPQVLIEARIVETTKRTSRSLGIAWGFEAESSAALGNTTGLDFPNNVASEGGVNLLTGGQNGIIGLTLGNVLDSFILDAQLQAAESEGLINVLSTPKIATLNNERAEIQSGLQIPIQTVSNNTVTVQFVNATLRLAVTPQVTAEGTVLMSIEIQKREPQLAFAVQGATNAPIATKEARTRVIVRDGGTTVIGGIYEVSADQGSDRVPGLANIPFIGRLFKNNRRSDENEELLIFITPRVIKI